MAIQLTPQMLLHVPIFLVTAALAGYGVARYVRDGRRQEVLAFVLLVVAVALWQVGNVLTLGLTTPTGKLWVLNGLNTIVVPISAYAILWFALAYANADHRYVRAVRGLMVVHVLLGVAAVTIDPEFFYTVDGLASRGPVAVQNLSFGEWVVLDRTLKPRFLVFQLFGSVLLLVTAVIFVRHTLRNHETVALGQVSVLSVGIGAPMVANAFVLVGVLPPALNATGLSIGFLAIALAVAVFRYRVLDLGSVGRKQFVEGMDDPLVFVDDANAVVYSNPTARRLFDVGSEWRGMDAAEFFGPHAERLLPASADRPTQNATIELEDADRQFDVKSSAIRTPADESGGQAIVLRDVTELKETHQRLDRFASMVSHDLRTPLNDAVIHADRIARERGDDRTEAVQAALKRMESMIDDMLELARAGERAEATEPVALAELVDEAWGVVETDGAHLDCRVGETTVEADEFRLFQVLENLFRNAIDHNDPPLTVRVGTADGGSDRGAGAAPAGFFVEDDGDGIPEGEREDIFDHGYTTSRDGNGYGLSIVRAIVEANGWTIRATDGPDGGTRFEILGIGPA